MSHSKESTGRQRDGFDVFLAHNSKDKPLVRTLMRELRRRGLSVWLDEEHLLPGRPWLDAIQIAIDAARSAAVLVGDEGLGPWEKAEVRLLLQGMVSRELPVIPVLLPGGPSAEELPLFLSQLLCVDMRSGLEPASLDRLERGIRGTLAADVRRASTSASRRGFLYNVPVERSAYFVGRREELTQISALLESRHTPIAIEGLAGIGKTELALQLVYQLHGDGRFPGGIFWIEARNPDLTSTWGQAIGDALNLPMLPLQERTAVAIHHVQESGQPSLIVLDDVDQWTRREKPHPLPKSSNVSFLVTTRQRRLGGKWFQHFSLGRLEDDAAVALLVELAGRQLENCAPLLNYLGGLALALELAGAYLAEFPEETPRTYLHKLQTSPAIETVVIDEAAPYDRSVTSTFETIWQSIGEYDREAWQLAARFEAEFATANLANAVGLDPHSRRGLRRLHLIEDASDGRWRMHHLLKDFASRKGSAEVRDRIRNSYIQGCAFFAQDIDLATGFQTYTRDKAHLDAALAMAVATFGDDHAIVSELRDRIGTALQSLGEFTEAREKLELALAADRKRLGADAPSVAARQANLALVLKELGELSAARDLLERSLEADIRVFAASHPRIATTRSNLALVLKDLGELERARELLEFALTSDLENFGESHRTVATRRSNLALVLKDMGQLERARDLLQQALDAGLANFDADHPSVATSRSNLALVLQDLGDYEPARKLLELALASDERNFGQEHPSVATSRFNLALVLMELGEWERACELLELLLASSQQSFATNYPASAEVRLNLALVVNRLGDLKRSRQLLDFLLPSSVRRDTDDD